MPNQFFPAYPDPNGLNPIPQAIHRNANTRAIISAGALLTTTLTTEFVFVGKIPSAAIILPTSRFDHGAAGGTSTIDLGFLLDTSFQNPVPAGAINCLAAAQSIVAAGSKAAMASVAVGNLGRRAWELAGLNRDPRREMDLVFRVQTAVVTNNNTALFALIDFALPA
jgi:subtilisin family serine protease